MTERRSGRMVAELEHVTKAYGNKTVIKDFSCRIMRGDRVGLLGPNGAGKSTLLKLILGELQPDHGTIRLGTKLAVAYFDQMREQFNDEETLVDTISQGSDFIDIGGSEKACHQLPGRFSVCAGACTIASKNALRRRAQPSAACTPVYSSR